ncbi:MULTISPECIES: PstS family phosphate ABC transporter substrate-binding protein [Nocardioides]|uniref:Phosphate-binding protein n=1 Tax=Nocardioides vastitatis TaxID=2568655 RepID=A0ABW0ZAV0_9ACTN|nr:PstS family phosphate ABC transporter substrate-binding protein [Nocardioides sp.]THJ02357.1 PstS family phosphate ABC transporter substrate-binding protein [Nocardioides sp.]
MNVTPFRRALVPGGAALALILTACGGGAEGGSGASGSVTVDGSSTVYPMSSAAAELLADENSDIEVSVGFAGTGGGFEKFCSGDTDISNASRPIKDEEATACTDAGIEYTELLVATDALTVVVHPDLAVDCLTTEQVVELFGPNSKVTKWSDLDPSFPDTKVAGFIPGTDSGTYDYMAADVVGDESETLREDFESSEDDNVLVQGVSGTEGAVGFFGYTYFEENADKVKALQIDDGQGCVAPSAETAQAGEYTPLARPLFIYVNNAKYNDNEAVKAYTDFYIENLAAIAKGAKYIPLNDEDYAETKTALEGLAG